MGTQKLLLPFRGSTVIGHIVDQFSGGPVRQTVVVVGADGAAVVAALAGRAVTLVENPAPAGDMLSSVRCGLAALPAECEAVLVALGDQPSIRSDLIARMVEARRDGGRGIVVPADGGRRGHPLLFSAGYREEILAGYDGVGLRGLLEAHAGEVFELAAGSEAVLADMDRPEDYRREVHRTE